MRWNWPEKLKIPKVIIPIRPGLNSAIGLLIADMRYDFIKTYIKKFTQSSLEEINLYYQDMERTALEKLQGEITGEGEVLVLRSADVRYFGQGHEIEVPVANKSLTEKTFKVVRSNIMNPIVFDLVTIFLLTSWSL